MTAKQRGIGYRLLDRQAGRCARETKTAVTRPRILARQGTPVEQGERGLPEDNR